MKSLWKDAKEHFEIDRLGVRPWPASPTGITVHYTADGDIDRVKRGMGKSKIGYHFLIDRDGSLHQTADLSKAVNHAGRALWNGVSPNRNHLAIAIISWGFLNDDGLSWNGTKVVGTMREGQLWDAASKAQEQALIRLLRGLMRDFNISAANICGHDECCIPKGRKVDPGCSLSITMSNIRKMLL